MWWNTFYNKFHRNETVIIAKYTILIWASNHQWETLPFGKAQEELYRKNCDFKNCYFTNDIHFFGNTLKGFDAIIFNGIRYSNEKTYIQNLPRLRFPHQKYVFLSSEPADYYPLCSKFFDNFFNWTYTYKLNSDCVIHYLKIETEDGKIIYPEKNMRWINATKEVSKSFKEKLKSKKKAAAWFVSRCTARSNRRAVYFQLKKELLRFNLEIDVFGKCGNLKCTDAFHYRSCYKMLERDYYFYLAFENSICDDYVTEKVLHALLNKVVPIVYGGANYSWFLPPGSYLDLRKQSVQQVALTMKNAISDPKLYASFFSWTNHYRFLNNGSGVSYSDFDINICGFCKLMNDKVKFENYSSYKNMRSWWLPEYKSRCGKYIND